MHQLRSLFALGPGGLLIFLRAWWLLARFDLLIRFRSYESWKHHLFDDAPVKAKSSKPWRDIIRISEKAARHHWGEMNCMRRSLAQKKLLAIYGYASAVHIGVAKQEDELKAHAWLTVDGEVANDTADVTTRYSELEKNAWPQDWS